MIEWEDRVLETAERFGGNLPHPDTSQAIATVYVKAPHAVTKAIDRVALEYQDGGIRSPWGILKSRVQQIQVSEHVTTKANDRERTLARAEQWVRNTGIHYDRETEILDELYGDRGPLRQHPDTQQRILELWRELRPIGEQIEAEHEQFMAKYRDQPKPEPNTRVRDTDALKAIAAAKGADQTKLT